MEAAAAVEAADLVPVVVEVEETPYTKARTHTRQAPTAATNIRINSTRQ